MNASKLMLVLAIHLLLYVTVLFDIPILRQCVGFAYLTFVPGFVIISAMGVKDQNSAVKVFLSVSLGVFFLMFVGLFVNTFLPLIGVSAPLSALPLLIAISVLTLVIFALNEMRMKHTSGSFELSNLKIEIRGFTLFLFSALLLVLSVVGSVYESSFLLLFVIVGSAAILVTSFFLHKKISFDYFALILFVISLSLLLQTSLISRHIMGWDIFGEYSAYLNVSRIGIWSPSGIISGYNTLSILNSVLSVTILPTVYSAVLNLDGELVLKIVFPAKFPHSGIGLYS